MDQRYLVRPCLVATGSAIDIGLSVNKSASTTDGFVLATVDCSSVQQLVNNGGRFCFDLIGRQCRIFDWPSALAFARIESPVLHRRLAHRAVGGRDIIALAFAARATNGRRRAIAWRVRPLLTCKTGGPFARALRLRDACAFRGRGDARPLALRATIAVESRLEVKHAGLWDCESQRRHSRA